MNQQEHLIRQIGAMVLELSRLQAEIDALTERLKPTEPPPASPSAPEGVV